MKNIRFLWYNYYDLAAATKTASSEAAGFPLTNIVNPWHTRRWRSEDVDDVWVKANLGEPMNVNAFAIKNHNFPEDVTSIYIQAHEDDAHWGDGEPDLDIELPWTTDRIVKFWDTPQLFQWWRLRVQGGGAPAYRAIGRIFLGLHFQPFYNFTKRFSLRLIDPSIKKYSSGGQVSVEQRTHYRTWGYEFQWVKSSVANPDRDTFESIFDYVGQSKPYFIVQDADDAWKTLYYVQNLSNWEIRHTFGEDLYSLNIAVEEMR